MALEFELMDSEIAKTLWIGMSSSRFLRGNIK
jgi:hypothetical protein